MAGMKGVGTEDVKAIRSYAYHSPKERIMPSLHMAYQCHQSRTAFSTTIALRLPSFPHSAMRMA